jgi:hypothetical protein
MRATRAPSAETVRRKTLRDQVLSLRIENSALWAKLGEPAPEPSVQPARTLFEIFKEESLRESRERAMLPPS